MQLNSGGYAYHTEWVVPVIQKASNRYLPITGSGKTGRSINLGNCGKVGNGYVLK
jgi:hypothetical protein